MGFSMTNAPLSVPIREPRDFLPTVVGNRNADYYRARFDEFEQCRTYKPSWNWAAFFFGYWWLFYRKMYLFGFVGVLIVFVLMMWVNPANPFDYLIIPHAIVYGVFSGDDNFLFGGLIYTVLAYVVFPMAANSLYYRHAIRQAEHLFDESRDPTSLESPAAEQTTPRFPLHSPNSVTDEPAVAAGRAAPGSPFRFAGKVVLLMLVVGGIIANVLMSSDGGSVEKHMERESPAVIAALNAFKERNGAYPEKLEQLVPDYVDSLPGCSPKATNPIPYQLRGNGGYMLTCYTYLTNKRTYDSASGKWFSWEDIPPPELRSP
jgi:hypothetical protein